MLNFPPVPSATWTRLGTVLPAVQLRLDATGRVTPVGKTVRKLAPVVLVTVTLTTTAEAPVGTPPCPVTCTSRDSCGPSGVENGPTRDPGRVSRIRAGGSG